MIHFRHKHKCIRKDLTSSLQGFPFISHHGMIPWTDAITSESKVVCTLFAGHDRTRSRDDIVYLAINPYWESSSICLPELQHGMHWHLAVDTADYANNRFFYEEKDMRMTGGSYLLGARSVSVFVAK